MAKLLRNITLEIIRLNRIDSLYDPQSIRITYYEQNVKRGRALFLFLNCLDSSGRVGWPYLLLYDHTVVSGLSFLLTYNVEFYRQANTDLTTLWCYITTLYCPVLGPLAVSSQQRFVYPALSQMTGGIREHVLQLVSLGHQETDVL